MLKKVIGAVLILLGGFFSFVAVKAVFSNPETVNQLEELPFITDGKVDPANDGKDIILLIKPDSLDNAGDFELGLGFKYPVIRREVEELKSDGEDQLKWTRLSKSEEDFTDEVFFGKITGLEYEVEGRLAIGFKSPILWIPCPVMRTYTVKKSLFRIIRNIRLSEQDLVW